MSHRAIDISIAPAALLVMKSARIADARQNQTMLDPSRRLAILREPRDRADSCRQEYESIRVPKIFAGEELRESHRHSYARQIVIRQRWMANVARDPHLVLRAARHKRRAMRQVARL